eukprot:gene26112-biopygen14122
MLMPCSCSLPAKGSFDSKHGIGMMLGKQTGRVLATGRAGIDPADPVCFPHLEMSLCFPNIMPIPFVFLTLYRSRA